MKIDKSYPNLNLFLIEFIIGVIIIWTQPRDMYKKSAWIHKYGGVIILSIALSSNTDICTL